MTRDPNKKPNLGEATKNPSFLITVANTLALSTVCEKEGIGLIFTTKFSVLRFSQPFSTFENIFKPLKLFLYSKLPNEIKQLKRFENIFKGQKRFCKA